MEACVEWWLRPGCVLWGRVWSSWAVAALLLCVVGSVFELGVGRVRGLSIWSVVSSFVVFFAAALWGHFEGFWIVSGCG